MGIKLSIIYCDKICVRKQHLLIHDILHDKTYLFAAYFMILAVTTKNTVIFQEFDLSAKTEYRE